MEKHLGGGENCREVGSSYICKYEQALATLGRVPGDSNSIPCQAIAAGHS